MNKYIEKVAFNLERLRRAAASSGTNLEELGNKALTKADELGGKYHEALIARNHAAADAARLSELKSNNRGYLLKSLHREGKSGVEGTSPMMKSFMGAPKHVYEKYDMPVAYQKKFFPDWKVDK